MGQSVNRTVDKEPLLASTRLSRGHQFAVAGPEGDLVASREVVSYGIDALLRRVPTPGDPPSPIPGWINASLRRERCGVSKTPETRAPFRRR